MTDVFLNILSLFRANVGKMSGLIAKYPSLFLLCGILAGIVPLINNSMLLFVPFALLPLVIFFTGRMNLLKFFIGLAVGLCSMLVRQHTPSDHYSAIIGRADCGAEIEVDICDSSCVGNTPWLPNPNLVFCNVRKFRYSPRDTWQMAAGKLAVRLPQEFCQVKYGDNLRLLGSFILPGNDDKFIKYAVGKNGVSSETTGDLSGFDFNSFLKARGVDRVFYAREGNISGHSATLTGRILQFRDYLLKQLCNDMPDSKARKLVAALIFGCKQGLDYQTKQEFIKTGTIHIFTVSGFHVGVLALMIFWLLRWMPFRLRYFLVPVIVFLYVLTTGMNPPAVRTLIMILIWAVCRGMLYKTPGLNIIFLAAALILAYNPYYLHDVGFQYSFVVVAVLVASINPIRSWVSLSGEYLRWIPGELRPAVKVRLERIIAWMMSALLGCMAAWLASSAITLFYQGFYFSQAVLLNFLIIPFVWMIFLVGAVKLLLAPLLFLSLPLAVLLKWLVEGMSGFCVFFYNCFSTVSLAPPGWLTILLFYVALVMLIAAFRAQHFAGALTLLAVTLMVWHINVVLTPPRMTVFSGGGQDNAALVMIGSGNRDTTVINVPDRQTADNIVNYLRKNGIGRISRVVIAGGGRDYSAGLEQLLERIPVTELFLPDNKRTKSSPVALSAAERGVLLNFIHKNKNSFFPCKTPYLKTFCKKNATGVEYSCGTFNINVLVESSDTGPGCLTFRSSDGGGATGIEHTSNYIVKEFLFK